MCCPTLSKVKMQLRSGNEMQGGVIAHSGACNGNPGQPQSPSSHPPGTTQVMVIGIHAERSHLILLSPMPTFGQSG